MNGSFNIESTSISTLLIQKNTIYKLFTSNYNEYLNRFLELWKSLECLFSYQLIKHSRTVSLYTKHIDP